MAAPIREQILEALVAKLSGQPAFSGHAAQRANSELDITELPAISLWDGSDASVETDQRYGQAVVTTQVGVETVHQANVDYATWSAQANTVLAELISAATGGDRTLDGLADDVRYAGTTLYYPEPGSDILGIDLVLEVRWRHDLGDPFTNSMG
ncbi:hypothetical protein [Halomonas borealis]|uniref:hypothetical protein n=1 Tax=Halomonas borealis TaxID=2508710 RepID=UPI001F0E574D|nr:hypothetical protein [Halomonas borealis]